MMEKVRLGDLECFISDGNYSSKYPRNDEFVKEGVPFIRCNNFKNNTIIKEDMYYITKEKHSFLLKGHVKEGDILITTRGSLGQIAIVPKEYEDANINAQIVLLRVNKEKVYNRYLMWQLKSQSVQNQIAKNKTGTALQQLPISRLKKIELFIEEDIKKQFGIAHKLDKVQEIIDLRKKQIEESDEIIKSQFVEMFGNEKYPKDEFINLSKEIYAGGDKPKDISRIKTEEYLYPVFANGYENEGLQGYSKNYRTKDESVTISARGTIGYSFIREGKFTPIVRLITITPNDRVNIIYLKYAIDNINIAGSGTSQAQLTVPNVKKQKIIVPPIELQNRFAEIVKQIDKQKFILEKTLKETEELQESLMNKYFG